MYITGDIHGYIDIGKINSKNFPVSKTLSKDDFLIISGDFGLIWDNGNDEKYWLKWLTNKKFTTLFIDGNHENFDLLDRYPVEQWNGGKVHKINDSIIHLMRGQVFEIKNKKIFTFGGANSHDKLHRKEGISWWKREMPSYAEYEEGLTNLDKCNWQVDFVISHTCSETTASNLAGILNISIENDQLHKYFETIQMRLNYQHWYFGHFHHDIILPNQQTLLFNNILKMD